MIGRGAEAADVSSGWSDLLSMAAKSPNLIVLWAQTQSLVCKRDNAIPQELACKCFAPDHCCTMDISADDS
jgi:hypothetical protein